MSRVSTALDLIGRRLAGVGRPCLTASFQADCVVLVHLVRQVDPTVPVVFLDTVHHFPQTLSYRDELVRDWQLPLVTLRASRPAPGAWREDLDGCCRHHKVEPLFAYLDTRDLWLTALRRSQSPSRAHLAVDQAFTLPSGRDIAKVSPLAEWSDDDVVGYARDHAIPLLPLYAEGYTSIGCEPCTTRPISAADLRSGRWQGVKRECGIHLPAGAESRS